MNRIKNLVLLFLALLLASCSTTKFEMDSSLESGDKEALLGGLSININIESEDSSGLITLAQNLIGIADLEEFGFNAEENLQSFLGSKGFSQVKNAEVAKRVEMPSINIPGSGYWVHPETSNYKATHFNGFTMGYDVANHVKRVKRTDDYNYFIYSDVSIRKVNTFGIFGGYPLASFNVVVLDKDGEIVLEAKAIGQGKKSFIGADLSKENLAVALEDAIVKINEL